LLMRFNRLGSRKKQELWRRYEKYVNARTLRIRAILSAGAISLG
jgi:hypothetical protein